MFIRSNTFFLIKKHLNHILEMNRLSLKIFQAEFTMKNATTIFGRTYNTRFYVLVLKSLHSNLYIYRKITAFPFQIFLVVN